MNALAREIFSQVLAASRSSRRRVRGRSSSGSGRRPDAAGRRPRQSLQQCAQVLARSGKAADPGRGASRRGRVRLRGGRQRSGLRHAVRGQGLRSLRAPSHRGRDRRDGGGSRDGGPHREAAWRSGLGRVAAGQGRPVLVRAAADGRRHEPSPRHPDRRRRSRRDRRRVAGARSRRHRRARRDRPRRIGGAGAARAGDGERCATTSRRASYSSTSRCRGSTASRCCSACGNIRPPPRFPWSCCRPRIVRRTFDAAMPWAPTAFY